MPPEADGIQVNHCKNPVCENFWVVVPETATRGPGAKNPYRLGGPGAGTPQARCHGCGETFPIKSNLGIAEELRRMRSPLEPDGPAFCPVETCENHRGRVPVGTKGAYASFGKTAAGARRWRCSCGRTFSSGRPPAAGQRKTSHNVLLFKLVCNKVPFARMSEIAGTSPPTVLRRFDFIHDRCRAFSAARERRLRTLEIERLRLGVDRQDHAVNWTDGTDKRNVVLSAVGTVDNLTGYCFGLHLNFDPDADPVAAEREERALGDGAKPRPHRRHARLWLPADHAAASSVRVPLPPAKDMLGAAARAYDEAAGREDVEAPEAPAPEEALPAAGAQVRLEYTLYAHFFYLRSLFGRVGKFRFFLDQDSGIRAAFMAAFGDLVRERRADALFVRVDKTLTVDRKRVLAAKAKAALAKFRAANPGVGDAREARRALLAEGLRKMPKVGPWGDRWLEHPFPSMSEPRKATCMLTDLGDMDIDHHARLHDMASLHGVDSLFNRLRRRVSILERPIRSASDTGRVWHGYAAYHPSQVAKALEIMRTVHNYVLPDKDGRTPAMKLGLARAPIPYEDILYFKG